MQVPKITDAIWQKAVESLPFGNRPQIAIANKAIEIALAEQSQDQPLISAEEARKLFENGQAVEMLMSGELKWLQCTATNTWTDDFYGRTIKYRAIKQPKPAEIGMRDAVYKDSTPNLHVGNSAFEDWFQAQPFATQLGVKQMCRDSYAAGMGDPLVTYATAKPEPVEPHAELRAMYEQQVKNTAAGYYAHFEDYPEEGSIFLDADKSNITSPQALQPEDDGSDWFYQLSFICRVLEGLQPAEQDKKTALGMARSLKSTRWKSEKSLQPITDKDVTDEMVDYFNSQFTNGAGADNESMIVAAYNAVIKHRSKAK